MSSVMRGWNRNPGDPDVFGPEEVMHFIKQARSRAPEDKKSLFLKTLAEKR